MFRIAVTSAVFAFAASLAGPAFATAQEPAANQPPDVPTELSMIGVGDRGCGGVVPGLPDISARVSDPDGGTLSAHFRVERLNGSTWAEVGTRVVGAANGSVARTFIDPAWAQTQDGAWIETKYRWTVVSVDDQQLEGPRSAPCEFVLDTTDPKLKVVKPTATVPGGGTVSLPHDDWLQRGTVLTMTLDPAGSVGYGGINDVDYYEWDLGFGAKTGRVNPSQLGSKVVLRIDTTDGPQGPLPLVIKAFDRSGRWAERMLDVRLLSAGEDATYNFDEGLTATRAHAVPDESPSSTFLLQGGANRSVNVPDEDFNLHLNGSSANAVSGNPVVRPPFSSPHRAFSIGMWVRPERIAGHRVLVSQGTATTGSVYALGIDRCANGAWGCPFFTLRNPDTRTSYTARAATPVRLNEWVYVAGSYNDFTSRGRRIQASATYPGATAKPGRTWLPRAFTVPRMSAGQTRIGTEVVGGKNSRFFAGHVEELRFFHGELGADDVRFQMFSPPEGPLAPE